SLHKKTKQLITKHPNLFPAKEKDSNELNNMIDQEVEMKHLSKNVNPYIGKIVQLSGGVISIKEDTLDDKQPFTDVQIFSGDSSNLIDILYLGKLDNVFED